MDSASTGTFGPAGAPNYWLTRFVLLRLLGAVYAVAFVVAINQVVPLIGSNGLLPASLYLKQIGQAYGSEASGFMHLPSLFWFWHSDTALLVVAWIGFVLSLATLAGYTNGLSLTVLWLLYMSFNHIGQDWYGYGWEIQLTETGFLAIFLCPFFDMRPFPKQPPPFPVIVLFRWLTFRIMFGAGLIKFRGDAIWRDGTALNYFFETQPIPGPLSRWFHFLPRMLLKIGVWFNWLAELVAPLFVFWPRAGRHIAGIVIIGFQIVIILSGNLSFLNWLTIVPAIACFDDAFLSGVLPRQLVRKAEAAVRGAEEQAGTPRFIWIVTIILGMLSVEPALNILSAKQIMNGSFDPLDLVNTYGAFGTVGRERPNVIFEGTNDDTTGGHAIWKPYIYKGLPVLLNKRPPQIAPYQLRLDWQMWFASMSTADQYPWTYNMVWKLLHNDKDAVGLFAGNPFPGKPPRYIRATLYIYNFAKPGNPQNLYWTRKKVGDWIPALSSDNQLLARYLKEMEWVK
ncbi:lipase maturation factor family protein [Mucilaginibacter sp. L3T2-6]|uniref:lipase maturation factor family protein n=1 Tax=Mucilaginibacter sp. L3T2-6 TaxID=3062491 RepID=UPI002674D869|nr:lipase maturation factor family protein [Mucilaginibacter sp. L3T2-6]MDO3644737.1 lipase maturation factor family protein [Mucilaginibacter sp. L3T2-6]MDV6217227.1 lipase maturation factor family protein [Mucilaginibacter sp. L3T2-6]